MLSQWIHTSVSGFLLYTTLIVVFIAVTSAQRNNDIEYISIHFNHLHERNHIMGWVSNGAPHTVHIVSYYGGTVTSILKIKGRVEVWQHLYFNKHINTIYQYFCGWDWVKKTETLTGWFWALKTASNCVWNCKIIKHCLTWSDYHQYHITLGNRNSSKGS